MVETLIVSGSTGFVGKNLKIFFELNSKKTTFISIPKEELNGTFINLDYPKGGVIHLAGKAHDLKNTSDVQEYFEVNTILTEKIFNAFLESDAEVFIFLSSVKAVADKVEGVLTENHLTLPETAYGKSKLQAEQFIMNKNIPENKRVYILRPCMIHGPGNKGNLNLLYKLVTIGFPWPLGAYENKRSYCSIDNLCFVINELLNRKDILSGIYQICDNDYISTNEIINIIATCQNKKIAIFKLPKTGIKLFALLGDLLKLPLNSERLNKLTENYIVSNLKIVNAIGRPLPMSLKNGLIKTIKSFN